MFNWYSVPTFGAMLLFWLLATYVITRSPRSPVALAAVAAQVATGLYLLGQALQANATAYQEWLPWARNLQWGGPIATVCWYWLTVLLLREQDHPAARAYLRRFGYPLGLILAILGLALTAAIYLADWLYVWTSPVTVPAARATLVRFRAPAGTLYPALVVLVGAGTLGAAMTVWLGRRWSVEADRRRRFSRLLVSAALFIAGANFLALDNWLFDAYWPAWLGHLALAGGELVMAGTVAGYSLLLQRPIIRTDLFYFLTTLTVIAGFYGLIFALAGPGYSFQTLALLSFTLIGAIISHALIEPGRRLLDRLFFGSEVQLLRSNLSSVVQSAALTEDFEEVLTQAQTEIEAVSTEHLVRLTEQALRRLNNPAALSRCGLIPQVPRVLAAARAARSDAPDPAGPTPLEQARTLRETLVAAIDRLKPGDAAPNRRGSPAALQYHILREEYVQGLPNRQIMTRHSVSESTFHRHRREAIAILARELAEQEVRLRREARESSRVE